MIGSPPRHRLALFTLFRDVASYVEEWIEFHRMMGVDHFFLYDNRSRDDWRDVLAPYLERDVVTVTPWPQDGLLGDMQISALRDCVKRVRGRTRWLGFLDVDEFLFPKRAGSVVEVLERHYRYGSGVSVHWTNFGPSGHVERPAGLVTESYPYRTELGSPLNHAVKTIYRPWSIYRFGGYAVHKPWCLPPTPTDGGHLQLNHYWSRSESELLERCGRSGGGLLHLSKHAYGLEGEPPGWEQRLVERVRTEYATEDRSIERFLPELRRRLGRDPTQHSRVAAG